VDLPTAKAGSLYLFTTGSHRADRTGTRVELPALGILTSQLIASVCRRIEEPGSPSEVVTEYAERSIHQPGDRLQCRVGAVELEGAFLGFSAEGHLRLDVNGVEQILRSGEIIE
jgi:hypothetical protein